MPKQVDHEARRIQIAEALLRLASRGGLEAVSLRDVAAEAGISMGAVQHYFRSKDQMLTYAMDHVNNRAAARIRQRIENEPGKPYARAVLRALMLEMLALSDDSRMEYLTAVAFFLRALSSPELAAMYRRFWPQLEQWIAAELRAAQESGDLPADRNPEREAEALLALPDGLSVGLLLGHRTGEAAIEAIDYHLDRLFGTSTTN
ncbi:TetR family transcriptional regulator C-terminal domain-containing protein [Saccharopolyspora sp. K220]|uniref:TetR/AcrR family transcriptional regulator n=1 Tax=Saccharopolyspora soli TaxID=2926618 RepID=UPI001F59B780|nr:TetR family transcriptional regulator C-terminal domain-containing protein [Saccharopolyspora soli]MCI2421189.1 TetR family transcriptional regulator C-terminal domain-containing protein [Saccharopolyspora soli]